MSTNFKIMKKILLMAVLVAIFFSCKSPVNKTESQEELIDTTFIENVEKKAEEVKKKADDLNKDLDELIKEL